MADSSNYSTGALHAFLWYGMPTVCNYNDTAWDTYAAVTFDISEVDTSAWTMLEAAFTASGSESNITLGAFQFNEEIDSVLLHHDYEGELDVAAYYIDDVELWACEVGMNDHTASLDLAIHPNPVSDELWFSVAAPITRARVFDGTGRQVMNVEELLPASQGRRALGVKWLPPGPYLLKATHQDGSTSSGRFVVAR